MKHSYLGAISCRIFVPWLALLLGTTVALAQEDELKIDVRSEILAQKSTKKNGPAEAPDPQLRVFRIRTPEEIPGEYKLVRPIDPDMALRMLNQLGLALEKVGFRHAEPSETPGILIMLEYGRGYLTNPYFANRNSVAKGNSSTMLLPDIRLMEAGVAQRASDANYEKLFMLVSAWDYQEFKQHQKGKRLWTTTISVDDPDHRDLTKLSKTMLAAGAEYFNRPTKEEAVQISVPIVPDGKVKVGTPKRIGDSK